MSKTVEMLKNYIPYNEQEERDVNLIIKAEEIFGDILTRGNKFCHLTASAFIINKEHTKVLCIFHNIYQSWCWVGGHADGDDDMLYVATKETKEETSLKNFKSLLDGPVSVEALPVKGHVKRGEYISAHTHFNVAYLFEAVGKIEKEHEQRYLKLLENVKESLVFSKDGEAIWKCRNCGHIVIGKQAPEVCPVCKHPKAFFEVKADNY